MRNPNLHISLGNIAQAIRGEYLGSIEDVVITAAGYALIRNWNDCNSDDPIDEASEMREYKKEVGDMEDFMPVPDLLCVLREIEKCNAGEASALAASALKAARQSVKN